VSQAEVERFLGRILTDSVFRARALQSLETSCFEGGFAITPKEIALLRNINISNFDQFAEGLDDSIRRR